MEGTLKYRMKVQPKEGLDIIKALIDEVKAVDGSFISLWHNDTLNNRKIWRGWKFVYEEMVIYATK